MKILSGIQPSGQLHIGNYFGMMLPMIRNMEKGELYAFIVNLHALTSVHDREKMAEGTLEAAADAGMELKILDKDDASHLFSVLIKKGAG